MLESFRISNFKSYADATLPLSALTVLIGANAAGKSNAIECMRLISWLSQGQPLSSIQFNVNTNETVVRGTVSNLPRDGENSFEVGCTFAKVGWGEWDATIENRRDGLHISGEKITSRSENVPLYLLDQPSTERATDVGVAYNNFARGGIKPHIKCIDQIPMFLQLQSPATFASSHKRSREIIPKVSRKISETLSEIIFLDPNPQVMRDYSFPSDAKVRGDGSNISAVLFNLCGQPSPDATIEIELPSPYSDNHGTDLLMLIKSLPEQNIKGIRFIHEPRGGVMVALQETFGNKILTFDASLLSDGTLRVLSIAAALLSAPPGSMVVIEEIDNGVHPSRAEHLLSSIQRIAERRDLRVLLSTHNPALLDAVPDKSIPDVVFCYRSPEDGTSKLVRLCDLETYPELVAQDTLGGLLTSGVLDRYAKIRSTQSERIRSGLEWLKSIRQS
ncbi:AAA family ATPase [Leisingera aquaemixtae]|uniref:AAA family ATPase n=1 Tax=Leisingera aquaemixtae TaxID=1396826 RepID=UPI001C97FA42|nr:ATP-binding protein [Leisingera aquaemixtae]MBY6066075.1 AAA family ATPase [Leisingera aquaemixtae]